MIQEPITDQHGEAPSLIKHATWTKWPSFITRTVE